MGAEQFQATRAAARGQGSTGILRFQGVVVSGPASLRGGKTFPAAYQPVTNEGPAIRLAGPF